MSANQRLPSCACHWSWLALCPCERMCADWSVGFGGPGFDGSVRALCLHDDGQGPRLYAAGTFETAGPLAASHIARFDGQRWEPVGSGIGTTVNALCEFDFGAGPRLVAGGAFASAGGVSAKRVAQWGRPVLGPDRARHFRVKRAGRGTDGLRFRTRAGALCRRQTWHRTRASLPCGGLASGRQHARQRGAGDRGLRRRQRSPSSTPAVASVRGSRAWTEQPGRCCRAWWTRSGTWRSSNPPSGPPSCTPATTASAKACTALGHELVELGGHQCLLPAVGSMGRDSEPVDRRFERAEALRRHPDEHLRAHRRAHRGHRELRFGHGRAPVDRRRIRATRRGSLQFDRGLRWSPVGRGRHVRGAGRRGHGARHRRVARSQCAAQLGLRRGQF
jgi:hypothetical protein